jgi:VanZ family protein
VNKKHFAWATVVSYCALIFIGSSIPGNRIALGISGIDKLIHTIEYSILSVLLFRSLTVSTTIQTESVFWIAVSVSSLYGLSDEVHQIFVPLRQFDVLDIASDASGSILGSYLMLRLSNNARGRPFKP